MAKTTIIIAKERDAILLQINQSATKPKYEVQPTGGVVDISNAYSALIGELAPDSEVHRVTKLIDTVLPGTVLLDAFSMALNALKTVFEVEREKDGWRITGKKLILTE